MAASQGHTFKIGFALSGAISAGAYTAGVFDYFFQALDAWENVRGEEGVPDHRVDLQVITGASAGAITGALGVVALARGIRPQKLTDEEKRNTYPIPAGTPTQDLGCVLPSLYETWVTRPRTVDPAGYTADARTDTAARVGPVRDRRARVVGVPGWSGTAAIAASRADTSPSLETLVVSRGTDGSIRLVPAVSQTNSEGCGVG